MELDQQQHDRPAADVIAQQYSSPTFVFWRLYYLFPQAKLRCAFQTCYYFIVFTLI